jgi:DNA-binding NtrC family response regulator
MSLLCVPIPETPPKSTSGVFAWDFRSHCALAICRHGENRSRLRRIFRDRTLTLYEASTWCEGSDGLTRNRPQVVICEADLPDADWREVLRETASLREPPRVIVISRQTDTLLWAEVLNLGGYDVLPAPLAQDEVIRVVELAWQSWKNERERQKKPESLSWKENLK